MSGLQQAFRFTPIPKGAGEDTGAPLRPNIVIEAGAGTGKTSAIVAEVLHRLLGNDELAPERIVLMTFTEKAAGEIADRIHQALAEVELQLDRGETAVWPLGSDNPLFIVPDDRREQYRSACSRQIARIDSIRSQTIHSFCQSLLRANPIEAGLDPQFKIVEGFERSLLYGRLYDEWLDEETRTKPTPESLRDWEFLLAHFGYLFQIRKQIFELINRRDLMTAESLDFGDLDLIEEQVTTAIAAIRRSDTNAINDQAAATIFRYVKSVEPPPRSLDAWIEYFAPIAKYIREAHLCGSRDLKEALVVFRTDRKKSDTTIYERLLRHRSAIALYTLTGRFIHFLDREKRLLGVADFDDLLLRTLALLENEDVLRKIRRQFDLIFVDEFQDTDRTQAMIIEKLATDDSARWVSGKLVVVGDARQSIYGFRRADPETYRAMTNALVNAGAEHRVLTKQYRSEPALLEAINKIFGTSLTAARPQSSGDERLVFLKASATEHRHVAEAESIAEWIKQNRDGSERDLQRFALLFRRLTKIDDYLDVFDRAGIDYVLPSTKAFLERRAPVDLLAVLRAIAFPFDRAAEFSAARTPYFALTDDEITEGMLSEEPPEAWREYQAALARYRDSAKHLTVCGTIDLLVSTSSIEAIYDSVADAKRAHRHLERVRAIAFEYDQKIGGSLRDFVEEIDRRREDPDEMEPSLADDDSNAVRILSVHAAKGLEFETVILPDLVFKAGNADSTQVFAAGDPPALVMTGRAQSLSAHYRYTAAGTPLKRIYAEREQAELRRLFYVAVTRAKRDVVFVCSPSTVRNEGFFACLSEVFGFAKDTFEQMWDEAAPQEVNGIAARFQCINESEREACGAARVPRAEGPLAPPDIPLPAELQKNADAIAWRASSKNRAGGILLHRLLERWDTSSDVDPLINALAAESGANEEIVARLRQRISTLRKSANFARIMSAPVAGRELVIRFAEGAQIVERRIDRLITENGEDVVVDYKSGAPANVRLDRDREQVTAYANAVSAMTGRPCNALLWYIDDNSDELIE